MINSDLREGAEELAGPVGAPAPEDRLAKKRYVCVCNNIYIYIYIYTHTYTCVYIYI